MSEFLQLTAEQRLAIFTQTGVRKGLPAYAIEKDWWVTQILRIVFSLQDAKSFVFKGGTSLSKGYDLIQRFSEDIDLAIDPKFYNRTGRLSKGQINRLRKAHAKYISGKFLDELEKVIETEGLPIQSIGVEPYEDSNADPVAIYITYKPLTKSSEYVPPRVLLEIGCRSMREPFEDVPIRSLVDAEFDTQDFVSPDFLVRTVEPQRTFLEKIFLLHEEWQKTDIRVYRLSRHLYDLEKLMDTEHAETALKTKEFFYQIVEHRKMFTPVKGVKYERHVPELIRIIPPIALIDDYESDYKDMQENMLAGEPLSWKELVERIKTLQERINGLDW